LILDIIEISLTLIFSKLIDYYISIDILGKLGKIITGKGKGKEKETEKRRPRIRELHAGPVNPGNPHSNKIGNVETGG
jgi:hypothetical protein